MRSSGARARDPNDRRADDLRLTALDSASDSRPAPSIRLRTRQRIETIGFFVDLPELIEMLTGQQMRLAACRIEEERARTRSWIQKFGFVTLSLLMMLGVAIVLLQGLDVVHLPPTLIKSGCPKPHSTARGIPWMLPEDEASGVLKSA